MPDSPRPALATRFDRFVDRVASVFEKAASFCIIVMVVLVTTEIVGRNFFHLTTLVADDVLGLLLGCMTFLGFAASLRAGAHIRVDFLTYHLSDRAKHVGNVVATLVALVFAGALFAYGLKLTISSFVLGTTTNTTLPLLLWPFQAVVPLGTLLFLVVLARYGVAELRAALRSAP